MPVKPVEKEWNGGDAFLIGGGASLRAFDFQTLRGRNTLGVNDAFRSGPEICGRILFGDDTWWQSAKFSVEEYEKQGGRVYSCAPATERIRLAWLHVLRRIDEGYGTGEYIGWNRSTGAAAINLAISLGAKRLFLLGYDCKAMPDRKTHWHIYRRAPTAPASFLGFMKGFATLAMKLKEFAPDVQIFNVSPTSALPHWPKISLEEMERMISSEPN